MAISKDLFLAILAMDSYNRGYGAGIYRQGDNPLHGLGGIGSKIGNATVIAQDSTPTAQAASFFAQAYTIDPGKSYSNPAGDSLTAGQKVISYRGTDEPSPAKIADFWTGWTIGAGYSAASQAGASV